jgi:hypothetical protein
LGQVQFKQTTSLKGAEARAVSALTIKIEPGGKVTGASNETGCSALGIAMSSMPTLLSLDVTLTACRDAGFNQHYNGTLAVYPQDKSARLMLMSTPVLLSGKSTVYDLQGTMRR